ncbi:MAG: M14 family metallopeptidase, partial [Pseudomonadota bacterium]
MDRYFATHYADARAKFVDAAQAASAPLWHFEHPLAGPQGERLSTDIAWLGAGEAHNIVVAGSATHGVEGFCGSGCQTGFLAENWAARLQADTALVLVHANNPHGFAHERRVNEDNIDLNRNFIDFDKGYPESPGYAALHPALVPASWEGEARDEADAIIAAYIEREGLAAFQQVTSRGQYTHPDGLFYGGTEPSWSRRTIEAFARAHLAHARRIAIVDFHTGLGPRGYGEIIGRGAPGDPRYERTVAWYGDDVRSAVVGNSASVRLSGTIDFGYQRACPNAEQTAITLEFGTLPLEDVHAAIRADNWLYARGGAQASPRFSDIKAQIRSAFYGEDSQWKADIWARG